ncbi:MAG: ketoacyl-ACP synthase III [Alcanivoracaceae bacterium]|nr:ketoacyl-ACP synthase III [Alcanivoracaceae bacterium]
MSSNLVAIDYYLPERVVTNDDLVDFFPEQSAQKILRSSGVARRHIAAHGQAPSDMAWQAASLLFEQFSQQGIDLAKHIDGLLFCTEIPDCRAPMTAVFLHGRLGLRRDCLALDIPAGCTGFMNGLLLAKSLAASKQLRNILLLTAEATSWVIPEDDLALRMIFSDGAAAALVSAGEKNGIGEFVVGVDSQGASSLGVPDSGARSPLSITCPNGADGIGMPFGSLQMNGQEVLRFSLREVPALMHRVLEVNNLAKQDIDMFIFHQASGFVLDALQRKCDIPYEKFYRCLENVGNTVSSTLPIALAKALSDGKVTHGSRVMLLGFGVGFSWSGTVIEWRNNYSFMQ